MKKITLMAVLGLTVFLFLPSISLAQTPPTTNLTADELQAQIDTLLGQVKVLQDQLAVVRAGTDGQWCHTFNTNLGVGATGDEVIALQTALQKENIQESGPESGIYDQTTASFVTAFQEKYSSDILAPVGIVTGTGYVGGLTRQKLNALYGCGPANPIVCEYPAPRTGCGYVQGPNFDSATGCGMVLNCLANGTTTPVDATCGVANGGAFSSRPTTDLCSQGNVAWPISMPTGTWAWSCMSTSGGANAFCNAKNSTQVSGVSATCGVAVNHTFSSAPTTDLCAQGAPSAVATDPSSGNWTWTCSGSNTSGAATCAAGNSAIAAPVISTISPSSGPVGTQVTLVGSGFTSLNNSVMANGSFLAALLSSDGRTLTFAVPSVTPPTPARLGKQIVPGNLSITVQNVGGTSNSVNFTVTAPTGTTPVNASCGVSNGKTFATQPTTDLCSQGTVAWPLSMPNGTWAWSCMSTTGGTNASCSAVNSSQVSTTSPITVTAPAGGETLAKGSQYTIHWTSTAISSPLTVNLSLLQNGTYLYQIASGVPNNGSYTWTVTNNYSGSGFAVYVSAAGILPATGGAFTIGTPISTNGISPSSVTFTAPQGGSNPSNQTLTSSFALGVGWQVGWTCDTPAPNGLNCGWLSDDVGTSSISLRPNISGVPQGTYTGGIYISQYTTNGWTNYQKVPVTLTVTTSTPVAVNASCGVSNGKTFATQPTTDLCSQGTVAWPLSMPNGTWAWSCMSTTGGTNASCSAVNSSQVSTTSPITVTAPAGGETLAKGSQYTIHWTSTAISSPLTVNLSLLQNGTYLYQIASGVPNNGSYTWTVTNNYSGSGFAVYVSAAGILPATGGAFTIGTPISTNGISPSSVTFTAPQGGSNPSNQTLTSSFALGVGWQVGWTCDTPAPNGLNCGWLSDDVGTSSISLRPNISGVPQGTYTGGIYISQYTTNGWTNYQKVPVTLTVTTSTPVAVNASCGVSNGKTFATQPTTDLCSQGTVAWPLSMPNGTWAWSCMSTTGGTNASCSAVNSSQVSTTSPITVTAPAGGETLAKGSQYTIHWTSTAISSPLTVNLSLLQNGTYLYQIASGVPNNGSYTWTVTNNYSGSGFAVYVSAAGILPATGGAFTIGTPISTNGISPSSVTFTAPQGGSNPSNQTLTSSFALGVGWQVGWTCDTPAPNGLNCGWLSDDVGTSSISLRPNISGVPQGTYTGGIYISQYTTNGWTNYQKVPVTLTVTTSTPVAVNASCGVSNGKTFATQPTTDLCSQGTVAWPLSMPNGTWAWSCMSTTGGTNASCSAVNSSQVSTTSPITVTAPAGGETLAKGSQYTIHWTSTAISSPLTVNLSLLQNGTYLYQIASGVPNNGSYTWTVTNNYSGSGFAVYVSAAGILPATGGAFTIGTPISTNGISPSSVTFTAPQGGSNPSNQTLTSSFALGVGWQVGWTCDTPAPNGLNCGWLSDDVGTSSISLRPNISGVPQGTYTGGIYISQYTTNGWTNYQKVPVTLTVTTSTPVAVNASCGVSNGKTFATQPTTDLCSQGTVAWPLSMPNGTWAWSCMSTTGGTNASCSAVNSSQVSTVPVNGDCGFLAVNRSFSSAPTTDLCAQGTASAITGNGPWSWTCGGLNNGATVACQTEGTPQSSFIVSPGTTSLTTPPGTWASTGITFTNTGSSTANWSVSLPNWILFRDESNNSITRGSVAPGQSQTLTLVLEGDVATPGQHSASMIFSGNFPTASSLVNFTVGSQISATPVNASCGVSNGKTFATQPTTDLCSQGTVAWPLSMPNGTWLWSCLSTTGGTNASCSAVNSASPAVVNGSCGSAQAQSFTSAPTTNLCSMGSSDSFVGAGPWSWLCNGSGGGTQASCYALLTINTAVNGSCGVATNGAFSSAPTTDLCSHGASSAVTTGSTAGSPWSWTCAGSSGGATASCTAKNSTQVSVVNGSCGVSNGKAFSSQPSTDLCSAGTVAWPASSPLGTWTWSCTGANGGSNASCSATNPTSAVTGSCGVATNGTFSSAPSNDLCATGSPSGVTTGSNAGSPWSWTCAGSGAGATVSCTAKNSTQVSVVNGSCGVASGRAASSIPTTDLCSAGNPSSVITGNGSWSWTCGGSGGGANASCSTVLSAAPASISVSPSSLSFTGQVGMPNPQGITFTLTNSGGSAGSWTASAPSWFSLKNSSQATITSGTVNANSSVSLVASVNTSGLSAGTYSETLGVNVNGQYVPIALKLTVLSANVLSVSSVNFTYHRGASLPLSEDININPSWVSGWTLGDSCGNGCPWLLLPRPSVGATVIEINIVSSLNAGVYTDNLIVRDASGNTVQTIPVTLTVS